jgi:hypothetical protein
MWYLQISDEARPKGLEPKKCHLDEPSHTRVSTEGAVPSTPRFQRIHSFPTGTHLFVSGPAVGENNSDILSIAVLDYSYSGPTAIIAAPVDVVEASSPVRTPAPKRAAFGPPSGAKRSMYPCVILFGVN